MKGDYNQGERKGDYNQGESEGVIITKEKVKE